MLFITALLPRWQSCLWHKWVVESMFRALQLFSLPQSCHNTTTWWKRNGNEQEQWLHNFSKHKRQWGCTVPKKSFLVHIDIDFSSTKGTNLLLLLRQSHWCSIIVLTTNSILAPAASNYNNMLTYTIFQINSHQFVVVGLCVVVASENNLHNFICVELTLAWATKWRHEAHTILRVRAGLKWCFAAFKRLSASLFEFMAYWWA